MAKKSKKGIPKDLILPPKGAALFNYFKNTYTSFVRSLKEAVSNSHDAGASAIQIDFQPKRNLKKDFASKKVRVTVLDDGWGMTEEQFLKEFLAVGSKKDPKKKNKTGRYPIGQFGIGSLAPIPFARKIEIYSCPKELSENPMHYIIDADKLNSDYDKKHLPWEEFVYAALERGECDRDLWGKMSDGMSHGTLIVLDGVTNQTRDQLVNGSPGYDKNDNAIKEMFPQETFSDGVRQIAFELSFMHSIPFKDYGGKVGEKIDAYLKVEKPVLDIKLSGVKLRRHVYCGDNPVLTKEFTYTDSETGVKAIGAIFSKERNKKGVPSQTNGVIVRLQNVAVGGYQLFGLGADIQSSGLKHVTGEIHIQRGLLDSIASGRNEFAETPAWEKLRAKIRDEINAFVNKADKQVQNKKAYDRLQEQKRAAAAVANGGGASGSSTPKRPTPVKKKAIGEKKKKKVSKKKAPPKTDGFVKSFVPSTGKIKLDPNSEFFRVFTRRETEILELAFRAMKYAGIGEKKIDAIVDTLILQKKAINKK